MHLITNLDHFGYANTSVFNNSSNNDKSGSFYLQIWIIFTSFILIGRWIRGRAQRNHVLTHVVFVPKVFSLAGRTVTYPGVLFGHKNGNSILGTKNRNSILGTKSLGPIS